MSQPLDSGKFSVNGLILPEWSTNEILVTGYQIVQAQAMTDGHDVRLGDIRVLIGRFALEYFTAESWVVTEVDADNFQVSVGPVQRIKSPVGTYMLVVTPNGPDAATRSQAAAALAATVIGGVLIYREVYTNIFSSVGAGTQIKGPIFQPPKNFPLPVLSREVVQRYKTAYQQFQSSTERSRIELSLSWFKEAHSSFDENAFLRYWLAIETLAMPNTTNIADANTILAQAYGVSIQQIQEDIEFGRLFGLRGSIVHNGLRSSIDPRLLNYIAAVYADLLEAILGLPCMRRALSQKAAIGASISAIIPHI
jgi:Apea-like HEPN